jgi:glyoxylase-like metal-dependent hydrolase (beta-lactamase superfamily II)
MNKKIKGVTQIDEFTYLIKDLAYTYLVIGSEYAMVIDTGIGISSIIKRVRKITDKELIVVNTHGHIDHIGNNDEFEKVYIHEDEKALYDFHNSRELRKLEFTLIPRIMRPFVKKVLDPVVTNIEFIKDGHVFNLGDRDLEVISVPGHTPGSIYLLDRKNRYLFSGDTLVLKGVLLNLDFSLSPQVFLDSMLKTKSLENEFDRVFAGHHQLDTPKSLIDDYIELANQAIKDEVGFLHANEFQVSKIFRLKDKDLNLVCKVNTNGKN